MERGFLRIGGNTAFGMPGASGLGEATVSLLFRLGVNAVVADVHRERGEELCQMRTTIIW